MKKVKTAVINNNIKFTVPVNLNHPAAEEKLF